MLTGTLKMSAFCVFKSTDVTEIVTRSLNKSVWGIGKSVRSIKITKPIDKHQYVEYNNT